MQVLLKTKVKEVADSWVAVEPPVNGTSQLTAHLVVWAGGVTPSPVIEKAGLKLGHHKGILVDECCQDLECSGVWAIGDCAEIPNKSGQTYAPTAQNATREGSHLAKNITAVMSGREPLPFRYTPIGEMALVGKRSGVASLYGLRFSGLVAWAMWRAVYLGKMPTTSNRLRVAASWLADLAFGRQTVELHLPKLEHHVESAAF